MTTNWRRDVPLPKHGIHWILDWRRQSIFHRDGDRCSWCGATEGLCLDHLTPRKDGGDNASENLASSCKDCNDSRGTASLLEWAMLLEDYEIVERGKGQALVDAICARAEIVPIDVFEGKRRVAAKKDATTQQGRAARRKTRTARVEQGEAA